MKRLDAVCAYSPKKNYPRQILAPKNFQKNNAVLLIMAFSHLVRPEILIICSITGPCFLHGRVLSGHVPFKELAFILDEKGGGGLGPM